MLDSKLLGDQGEQFALELLKSQGYTARLLPTNYKAYDIEVLGPHRFYVSVKTSKDKQHVRLGSDSAVAGLSAGNFVFAFLPSKSTGQIEFRPGGYRLLIIPAEVVKDDGLALMKSYKDENPSAASFSYIVKGYSKRRQHPEVWSRWASYENAWQRLKEILLAVATPSDASQSQSASELISQRIAELGDWRGETLALMRALIQEADPEVVEEWKYMGTPIWSHDGIICTGETYKSVVKLTFAKGASLDDPARLFNASLEGNVRRAIDIHEGEAIDEAAFQALVREAIALNSSRQAKPAKKPGGTFPARDSLSPVENYSRKDTKR